MKKKKIVVGMLIMCLLCVNLLSTAVRAEVSQPTTHNVHDSYEFRNAVKDAKDGDIISVYGAIEINMSVQIGSDTKHLTIQRVDENSYIIFNYVNAEVTNTVFDGMGKKSLYSWITTNYEAIFTGCTFQNCGSSENLSSSGSVGGAVKVQSGSCVFNNCVFSDNYALSGGHIAVLSDSQVELNYCTLKNGGAVNSGGAVAINSSSAFCEIRDGEITGNCAYDFGGGIANRGTVTIEGTKLYNNAAPNGGADIGNTITGAVELKDTIEQLFELFEPENILPLGWVCDYDFDEGIYIPDVDPYQEDSLLKLQYEIIPDKSGEETEGTESGTEEGTESTDPVEPNEPSTDQTEEAEGEQPTELNPPDESETDPSETPEQSTPGESTETSDENNQNQQGTDTPLGADDGTQSTNNVTTDNSNVSTSSNSSVDSSTNTSTINTDNHVTSTDNSDHSRITENNDSSDRSTVNNNYYSPQSPVSGQAQQSGSGTVIVVPGETSATGGTVTEYPSESVGQGQGVQEKIETGTASQNISIDAKGVDCTFEMVDGVYSISISANQAEGADHTDSTEDAEPSLYQIIQILLLVTILICSIWKPKSKEV